MEKLVFCHIHQNLHLVFMDHLEKQLIQHLSLVIDKGMLIVVQAPISSLLPPSEVITEGVMKVDM